jgi:hypothetical protein
MFNRDYSWINSMFHLNVGKWIHIVIVIIDHYSSLMKMYMIGSGKVQWFN